MILIDFNQTAISNLMAELGSRRDVDIKPDLLRHMILNSIRSYKQKFGAKFGDMVICCDNRKYWRKEVYKYYKAGRKKAREESGLDWPVIFSTLDELRKDLNEVFPYKVIDVEGAEADDVIGTLCEWSQENYHDGNLFDPEPKPVLILSGDKDFIQLQKWKNISQFSPILKKYIKPTNGVDRFLFEHIIKGDTGDGVPNVLSDDDTFVSDKRQKPIYDKKMDLWFRCPTEMPDTVEFKRNFQRNKMMVDLSMIPQDIKTNIINSLVNQPKKDRSQLINYFIKHKMKNMLECVAEF